MITELGTRGQLWTTDNSEDAAVFTAANLAQYAVVVWCNTSGDNLLSSAQQAAFEGYIRAGGGFVGIHAATDTYRNGSWSWYNQLVGGIVQTAPNHTAAGFSQTMDVVATHPAASFLGSTWNKAEEYYYWEQNGGYLFPGNINLLRVRSTGNNSYDAPRPVAWYKEFDGGRSFYTALGHNDGDYQNDERFRTHVQNGIEWAARRSAAVEPVVRINCGGGEQVLGDGRLFVADQYFTGGKSFANAAIADISNTSDDELYRTEHSATADLVPFSYNIPVASGTYKVLLHFAEIYFGATNGGPGGSGKRVFSVNLEGSPVLVDYDISAAAGPMRAVIEEVEATVTDGTLTLDFSARVDQPSIAAIEVLKSAGNQPATPCVWRPAAPSDVERKEGQSAVVAGKMYTFGGYYGGLQGTNLTQQYEVATNRWTTLAPMPVAVTHMGAVVVGRSVWLIGGFVGNHPGPVTAAVQVYDTEANTWSLGPPLPAPRGSGAAAVVGRNLHAFGGVLPDRHTDSGDHYVLNLDNVAGGWQVAAPMPEPRNHLGGASLGGKVYAIGGQRGHDGGRTNTAFLHVYDPTNNAWTKLTDLPGARSHFEPGTIVLDGKILLVGGSSDNSDYSDIQGYDPKTGVWSKRCELPGTLVAPFAKVLGNQVVVAQGARDNGAVPDKATWLSTLTSTPSSVLGFSASQMTAQVAQGGTITVRNLLWTLSGTASYTLALGNAPAWLALAAPTGTADPLGQEIVLQINAASLVPGTYTATVQATAPGYSPVSTTLQLSVTGSNANPVVFAVNAGGAAYTTQANQRFDSDRAFAGGELYRTGSPIAGTDDDELYQTERHGDFSYAVSLLNGTYDVTFKLAEIYFFAPGQRIFDVLAEGQEIISNLDIYAQVGQYVALDVKRTVTVTDGELNLQFRADVNRAKLAALLIESVTRRDATIVATKNRLPGEIFPNPTTTAGRTVLRFTAPTRQPARVEVLDGYGRIAWQTTYQTVKGVNELEIKKEKLGRGMYYLKLYLPEGVVSEKMIIAE